MAWVELAGGSDDESRALAKEMITAQSQEIIEMNEWRTKWYGSASPAGGIPAEEAATSEPSSQAATMEH